MSSVRTQVYLTVEQRDRIAQLVDREGGTLAEVVRTAIDRYLGDVTVNEQPALDATFGTVPDLTVPDRDGWDRG